MQMLSPVPGTWYKDLQTNELFEVIDWDPDQLTIETQYLDGEVSEYDLDAWRELTQPWSMEPPQQVARPVGCKLCRDTGYMGRQGIYEVLVNSPLVQSHIKPLMDTAKVREVAMSEGMHTLRLSGAARVARGETTIEEVMRVAPLLDI